MTVVFDLLSLVGAVANITASVMVVMWFVGLIDVDIKWRPRRCSKQ